MKLDLTNPHCSKCKKTGVPMVLNAKPYCYCRECNTERLKRYRNTEKGRININNAVYHSIEKHREKQNARMKLNYALKNGKISKTKCSCGEKKVEAHHSDYTKPLQVIWVCRSCHSNLHK